jgi:hypothetical protein
MHAAAALAQGFSLHAPTDCEKQRVGQVLHYTFGTATGALYGSLAEALPVLTTAAGVPFGAVVWLLADEIAVPALASPSRLPIKGARRISIGRIVLTTQRLG